MFCVYCGNKLVNGSTCSHCHCKIIKVKLFTSESMDKNKEFFKASYCHHCGEKFTTPLENNSKTVRGICNKCCKPYRVDVSREGDSIFV